jgi:diguanylate cyclase (GGDEF)-like protein
MSRPAIPRASVIVGIIERTAAGHTARRTALGVCVAILVLIAAGEAATAPAIRITGLSVLPIVYLTWATDVGAGLIATLGCVLGSYAIDVVALGHSPGRFSTAAWNALIDLVVCATLAVAGVASVKHALGQQRALARQDPLTGVANRRMFAETAEREIARCRRYRRPFTIAVVDLDGFKRINDTYGHQAGDDMLKRVTARIRASVRAADLVARLGGDEFVVLLPETGYEAARAALEKVRSHIDEDVHDPMHVTASIGAVTFNVAPESADAMLRAADAVMYAVKQRPVKNAILVADASASIRTTAAAAGS